MRFGTMLTGTALLALAGSPALAEEDATAATRAVHAAQGQKLDWSDESDFANAERGKVARYPEQQIKDASGKVVWTFGDYDAMRHAPAPPTVSPLLWREQRLNMASGLFQAAPGVYQLRGFDLAVMTVIEGKTGVIVVDPLTSVETARAALGHYYAHRPRRPVVAVIYTHSHMDHFGGVRGVVDGADVASGKVTIYAPVGFLEEAVSENVTAGNAMLRRTIYYSGLMLPRDATGTVGAGLGPGVANGRQSFIAPTKEIAEPGENVTIDGVPFEFRLANETEAPAELIFFLPDQHLLHMSEVAVHTVHNVLTPRGAQVRDTQKWWEAIDAALREFGGKTDVLTGSHHWPTWGRPQITAFLGQSRDFYKLVHDRALRLTNQGEVMDEIGEQISRNEELAKSWPMQDYYGTLSGAGMAVYQRYIGWYDGNPANLQKLPASASAARYVEYMGGAEAILKRALADYDKGEYRWVAEVLNRLIFAQPDNAAARELQARTLTQLGYQQISASVRNVYLTAALELRKGILPIPMGARLPDFVREMPPRLLLDYAGIALVPERAGGRPLVLDLTFRDTGETFAIRVADGLLTYRAAESAGQPLRVTLDKPAFDALLSRRSTVAELVGEEKVAVTGDVAQAIAFFALFDSFAPNFPIVTP